jgi:hypothetical protein
MLADYSEDEDDDDDEVLKMEVETKTFTQEIQVSEYVANCRLWLRIMMKMLMMMMKMTMKSLIWRLKQKQSQHFLVTQPTHPIVGNLNTDSVCSMYNTVLKKGQSHENSVR